ncbi:MAG: hypothetical protein HC815_17065 [Richelia sp. RM1_1_1]|nr:hypothetical protein [Richelia sp. RM1_1_1]
MFSSREETSTEFRFAMYEPFGKIAETYEAKGRLLFKSTIDSSIEMKAAVEGEEPSYIASSLPLLFAKCDI